MPAAWPVLPLGTMINQQNTPDDQASAQRLGHRDPLLTAPSSCTPNTKYQGFTRWGRTAEPPRGVPQAGGIQEPGRTLLSCYLGLRTCQKVRVAKRNRRSRNSPSGVGSLLQVILEHLAVHLLGPQVPRLPAWPTYLIKDCPCNAYKKM